MKRDCNNMGELMVALIKYADSDDTKDPESNDEKSGKGNKSGNTKGLQHNPASQGGNGKHKVDSNSNFVANTNMQNNGQRRKGKPPPRAGGSGPNLEKMLNHPCPKHGTWERPSNHLWKDCQIMKEFKNSDLFQNNHGPGGGSGSGGGGSHGPGYGGGSSSSGFQGHQNHQGNQGGYNQQSGQGA